jgi:plasmid stabilization system protein ParE
MTFDFHPEAREEFHDASHWYEDRSIFAGDRFVNAVRAAVTSILADPLRYQVVDEGIRVCRLKNSLFASITALTQGIILSAFTQ